MTTLDITPVVEKSVENKGVLEFTIKNTNVSIVNGIRRTLLTNISTSVIDSKQSKFYKNTGRLHNEILKQRLDCIPVHIKDTSVLSDLLLELDMTNDTDSLMYVTSRDFKIKNISTDTYLTDDAVENIFPAHKNTQCFILFSRLRPKISSDIPGEKLHFTARFKEGTAKENGAYNVVSIAAYANTPSKSEQADAWGLIEESLIKKGMNQKDIDYERKNWYTLEAKRIYLKDSYDFKVQSIGVYSNLELINLACDKIKEQLQDVHDKCSSQIYEINMRSTAMKNSADLILQGYDYTIGKVIEYILHEEYYKGQEGSTPPLSYVGFIKEHPHDDHSIIRFAFKEEDNFNKENIYNLVMYSCNKAQEIYDAIKEYFL
tara:strand:- start:15530 stop:16651 length:1122 start_codon:yes stop_codon:yes gene_type:complete